MLKNKYLMSIALFAAGGITTYLILPSKTKTVVETKIVEKVVNVQTDTNKKKITKPDGTIIETENTKSVSQTEETEKSKKYEKTVTNPKKILVYIGKDLLHPANREYVAGFSYQLWGPIDVGAQYNSKGHGIYGTLGIRF